MNKFSSKCLMPICLKQDVTILLFDNKVLLIKIDKCQRQTLAQPI